MKVYVFGARSGGVGKTTVSFNTLVATQLIAPPPPGLLDVFLECDFGRQSAVHLWNPHFLEEREASPDSYPTLREYLAGVAEPWEIAYSTSHPAYRNLVMIPSAPLCSSDRELLKSYSEYSGKMLKLLEFLKPRCRLLVIDAPGAGGLSGLADYLLLIPLGSFIPVVQPDKPSIDEASQLVDIATLAGSAVPAAVINKYRGGKWAVSYAKAALAAGETQILTIRDDKKAREAYEAGVPVVLYSPSSRASKDIKLLAQTLASSAPAHTIQQAEKRARILSKVIEALARRRAPQLQLPDIESILRELDKLIGHEGGSDTQAQDWAHQPYHKPKAH